MQPKEPDLGSQVFQDALLMAAPMSRGPTLQAVVEFQNQTPTGWKAREIRVRIRVQQGLPLQRGRYRDTWELLFVLRIQRPAQGLCIHSETPSYIRKATIPASRGPCKDFTLPPPIFWEVRSRCPSTSIFSPPKPRSGFSNLIPGCRPSAVYAPF